MTLTLNPISNEIIQDAEKIDSYMACAKRKDAFGHLAFANNEGPDQPAHLRRLIWAFAVRLQNHWLLKIVLYVSLDSKCSYAHDFMTRHFL